MCTRNGQIQYEIAVFAVRRRTDGIQCLFRTNAAAVVAATAAADRNNLQNEQ